MRHPCLLLTFLPLFCLLPVSCKKAETTSAPAVPAVDESTRLQALYQQAVTWQDYSTASIALLELIAVDPAQKVRWTEEVAKLYYAGQRYESCASVCQELIMKHDGGRKGPILQMYAMTNEALGRREEAIALWKQLTDGGGGTPMTAVRFGGLLLDTGKLKEASEVVQAALALPNVSHPSQSIALPAAPDRLQNIPAEAALQNLAGLLAMKQQPADVTAARAAFDKALKLAPDFEIARRNAAGLQEGKPETSPAPAAAASPAAGS